MIIKLKIKEARESKNVSIKELAKDTGIGRDRLVEIENNVDEILFIEMLVIAESLDLTISDLYELGTFEIKGIGEI